MSPPSSASPSSSPQSLPSLPETAVPIQLPYIHPPDIRFTPWQSPPQAIPGYVYRLDEPATTVVGGGDTPVSRSPSRGSSRSTSPTGSTSSSENEYDDHSGSEFHSNCNSRRTSMDRRRCIERRARDREHSALARLSNGLQEMGPLAANAATTMAVPAAGRALIGAANIAGTSSAGVNLNPNPNTNPNHHVSTSTPTPTSTAATPNPHTGPRPPLPGGGEGETVPPGAPGATTTNGGPPPTEAEPPPYREDLKLIPMTSEQTSRYDRGPLPQKNLPKHYEIPMALYTLTPPPMMFTPPGWIEFVHPEGIKYYYHPIRRIITDSNIKSDQILQVIYRALTLLDMRLNAQGLILPPTTEVTLEVDLNLASNEEGGENTPNGPPIVKYYFVDHAQKTEFWLEKTTTAMLKCPPVTSYTHLKYLFRQHYWTHIEFYPMHLTLSSEVEDELVAILTHACIDYMTSSLSTVPYNQEQCESYLRLVRSLPESDRAEGYRNCVLARLWSEIDGNFFVNLRGEDTPRLSRIQRLLPEPTTQTPGLVGWVKSWMMLGSSEWYERMLGEMWVDKISYASHWRKFMSGMVGEWKLHAAWTFVVLIVSSLTFTLSMTSDSIREGWSSIFLQVAGLIAILVSLVGLGTSFLLVRMHRGQPEASASEAGDYLERYFHPSLGLQPLSLIYALPQASSVWSFTFLSTSILAFCLQLDALAGRILITMFLVFVCSSLWFLTLCLNKQDDGTGSYIKGGAKKIRQNGRERWKRVGERLGRPRVRGGENAPITNASVENGINNSQANHGEQLPHYVPRSTTTLESFTSAATYIGSALMTTVLTAFNRQSGRHDSYNRYTRVQTTESPLESMFRNPNAVASPNTNANSVYAIEEPGLAPSYTESPGSGSGTRTSLETDPNLNRSLNSITNPNQVPRVHPKPHFGLESNTGSGSGSASSPGLHSAPSTSNADPRMNGIGRTTSVLPEAPSHPPHYSYPPANSSYGSRNGAP